MSFIQTPQYQIDVLPKRYSNVYDKPSYNQRITTEISGHEICELTYCVEDGLLDAKILESVDGLRADKHAFIRDDGLWLSHREVSVKEFKKLEFVDLLCSNFVNIIPPFVEGYISSLEVYNKIGEAANVFRRWRRGKPGGFTHGDIAFYPLFQYLEWLET